jgi:hypothetical protein
MIHYLVRILPRRIRDESAAASPTHIGNIRSATSVVDSAEGVRQDVCQVVNHAPRTLIRKYPVARISRRSAGRVDRFEIAGGVPGVR